MPQGGVVTKSLESVLSHDGGKEQLAANVHESRLAKHTERGNICVKLATNNTSIQQDLDKVKTGFKALKHQMRTLSRQTIPSNVASDSLEATLRCAKAKYGLNLVGSAKTTLVEEQLFLPLIQCQPT
jgi:hypothetical protein